MLDPPKLVAKLAIRLHLDLSLTACRAPEQQIDCWSYNCSTLRRTIGASCYWTLESTDSAVAIVANRHINSDNAAWSNYNPVDPPSLLGLAWYPSTTGVVASAFASSLLFSRNCSHVISFYTMASAIFWHPSFRWVLAWHIHRPPHRVITSKWTSTDESYYGLLLRRAPQNGAMWLYRRDKHHPLGR